MKIIGNDKHNSSIYEIAKIKGFDIRNVKLKTYRKDQLIRDAVRPEIGLHILKCALTYLKGVEK